FYNHDVLPSVGCSCFVGGQCAVITQAEYVVVTNVLHGMLIYLYPAFGIGQGTVPDKVRRALWRCNMQKVEVLFHLADFAGAVGETEGGNLVLAVNGNQIVVHQQSDIMSFGDLSQGWNEIGHAEQRTTGCVEFQFAAAAEAFFAHIICCKVGDFLGGTGTFDGCWWLSKQGFAALECLQALPGVFRHCRVVITADAVAPDCISQAFHSVPVQFQARCHYQNVVSEFAAIREQQGVGVRLQFGNSSSYPAGVVWQGFGLGSGRFGKRIGTAAHQSECGLVIMNIAGLNNRNVQPRALAE